jgi:NAD+ synthase (glutamine-hydrolysing)
VVTVFKVFGGHSKSEIEGWVAKFDLMWRGSQWKRERFAPSFHLDDFSVDPKSFCRFPIFSGEG